MSKFSVVKNGYDTKEVDDYIFDVNRDSETKMHEQRIRINDLKKELEDTKLQLAGYKERNSNISDALVVAVETAKQIENSSKNIYALEIKRIRALYDKWKNFLNEFMKKYPELGSRYDTNVLLKTFSNDIDDILKQNKKSIEQKEAVALQNSDSVSTGTIGLRMLINKMGNTNRPIVPNTGILQKGDTPIVRQSASEETLNDYKAGKQIDEESSRLSKDQIKPISNLTMDKTESYENLVDKFLTTDDEKSNENAYSKILLAKQKNEQFDLKAAVTPTEDLDEIMKSFNFYPENTSQKNKN